MTQDSEMYEKFCSKEFEKLEIGQKRILDALFMDGNGHSLQSRVNQNTETIRRWSRIYVAVGLAVLSLLVWIIQHLLGA